MKWGLLFILIFISSFSLASAEVLKISTIERKPFVFKDAQGNLAGFSIDLWREVATRNDYKYNYIVHTEFAKMLESVEQEETNMAIANISITSEREKVMDFSYPYYDSGVVVLIPKEGAKPLMMDVIMGSWLLRTLVIVILLFMAGVHMTWLHDRQKDFNRYDKGYKGVVEITKKTFLFLFGKYRKDGEIKVSSRLALFTFLILSSLVFSIFISKFTSYTIVNSLQYKVKNESDLLGVKLGVAKGTTMESYAQKKNLTYKQYSDFLHSVHAVENLQIDAALGSAATSKYYASHQSEKKVIVAGSIFQKDKIAIAFPSGAEQREQINKTLLQIQEDGTYQELINRYFGK